MFLFPVAALLIGINACGDDVVVKTTADGGLVTPTPLPYDGGTPLIPGRDSTGRLRELTLLTDVGASIDGLAWSAPHQTLFFAVPEQAPTLRRLTVDGRVLPVTEYDGGTPGPYGVGAREGRLFLTEPNAIVELTVASDDGGASTIQRHGGDFGLLSDIVTTTSTDGGVISYVNDTDRSRVLRYDPNAPDGGLTVATETDAGRTTGVAVRPTQTGEGELLVAVRDDSASYLLVAPDEDKYGGVRLSGPANGIAVDQRGFVYVAWARGIDVYDQAGNRVGASPGMYIEGSPTNLAFGGSDSTTLYVATAAGKLYSLRVSSAGVLR